MRLRAAFPLIFLALSVYAVADGPEISRKIKTDRTYLFCRSQWKYGLQRDDYLNLWIDRPLFVNPSLRDTENAGLHGISYPSFLKTEKTVEQYGLDGLAFFPETSGRMAIYDFAKKSGDQGFLLLTEFAPGKMSTDKIQVLRSALENQNSFRIGDKLVVTSYNADSVSREAWTETLTNIRRELGDRILFLPAINRFGRYPLGTWAKKFHANKIQPNEEAEAKKEVRQWLRIADGIHFASAAALKNDERKFDDAFYRGFVIRIMKDVLSEPEFEGKYFGLSALAGHENTTRLGYTHSSDGTKTLRRSLEAAIEARPEIINIPEWDEQNENTSLRPTVYNGTSSMRILRYYSAKVRGTTLEPIPGDRKDVPNLILSYRKLLVLGEKLELELLNVPDGTGEGEYTARVKLLTPDGKEVYSSSTFDFAHQSLKDHTISIPTETLKDYPVLLPQLELASGKDTVKISDGLHYIELRGTWNWDCKWVKQPLRDLLTPAKAEFSVSPASKDGARFASVELEAGEPLAYLEVLDNDDVVYSHSEKETLRESSNEIVVSLFWQSHETSARSRKIKGNITLRNGTGRWLLPSKENSLVLAGNVLKGLESSLKPQRVLVAIPKSEMDEAVFDVNLEGVYQGAIPVRQIMDGSMFGIPGPNRFNLVFSRYLRQNKMPMHLEVERASFSVPVLADLPNSVFHFQAIGISGRVYRSKPIRLNGVEGGERKVTVYSDTEKRPVVLAIAAERAPRLSYPFDGSRGSILYTKEGRTLSGILGDRTTLVIERGGGQSGDGTPFYVPGDYATNATRSAPEWIDLEGGGKALRFDGKGTFVVLPQGAIPRRAAFTVSMEIRPENTTGRQLILANRERYLGSLSVYSDNGNLKVDFLGESGKALTEANAGIKLEAGKWSRLQIAYDQERIRLSVDGVQGRAVPAKGPGYYDMVTVIGGFGEEWFDGDIRNLEITQGVDSIAKENTK